MAIFIKHTCQQSVQVVYFERVLYVSTHVKPPLNAQYYNCAKCEENKSLKTENDTLKQRCENLVYTIGIIENKYRQSGRGKNFAHGDKNLQTDADLNQPLNKQDHNVNC